MNDPCKIPINAVGFPPKHQRTTCFDWLNKMADGAQLWRLFEDMPDVLFFIKDKQSWMKP